jgi:hypothetical protein
MGPKKIGTSPTSHVSERKAPTAMSGRNARTLAGAVLYDQYYRAENEVGVDRPDSTLRKIRVG